MLLLMERQHRHQIFSFSAQTVHHKRADNATVLAELKQKLTTDRSYMQCNSCSSSQTVCVITLQQGHTHKHTHPFNGPFSGTTRVSRYQKGKTNLDFTEARDSEWQWHQLGHMQDCKSAPRSRQKTCQHPTTHFFKRRMPFLSPNQQRQSIEGKNYNNCHTKT